MIPSLVFSKIQCGGNPGGPVLKTLHLLVGAVPYAERCDKKKKKKTMSLKKGKEEHEAVRKDSKRLETMKSNMCNLTGS